MNHLQGQGPRPRCTSGARKGARYTRSVSLFRQRTIGAFLVAVLPVLPVSGPLCSALCAPAGHSAASADHGEHGVASACHDAIGDDAVFIGASAHNCSRHNGPVGDSLAAVSANRADAGLMGLAQHLAPSVPRIFGLTPLWMHSRLGVPTAFPRPTRTPLVLRI